ncbi:MAG: HIT family protein [Planctomycetota bacterium]
MNTKCIFCKIIAGEVPAAKIFENDKILSFMDIVPISDGHTLVVTKEHFERLHECPADLLGEIGGCMGNIAKAVVKAMDCDGYNVLCNNGRSAGQLVGHLHFHIIPRNANDGVFNRWPAYKYPPGKMDKIAEEIRRNL